MNELRDLERLKNVLNARLSMGFFLDGDQPYVNFILRNESSRKSHLKSVKSELYTAINHYSQSTSISKLNVLLDAAVEFWNDANSHALELKEEQGYDKNTKALISFYFREAEDILALVYTQYLAACKDDSYDLYDECQGLTPERLEHALKDLSICTAKRLTLIKAKKTTEKIVNGPETNNRPSSPNVYQSKEKQGGSESLFSSPSAILIYTRLEGKGFIKSDNGLYYQWQSTSKEIYAYICYRMSKILIGDDCQIESGLFSKKIHSKFNLDTIARYARKFKSGEKILSPEIKEEIDSIVK